MLFAPAVNVSPITQAGTAVDTLKKRCMFVLNRFRIAGTLGRPAAVWLQQRDKRTLIPYQTTASSTVAQQSAVAVSSGQFTYTLPAQSITTFVQ